MIASRTARQLGWLAIHPEDQRALRLPDMDRLIADRLVHNDNAGDWRLTPRGRRELSRYRCDLRTRLSTALAQVAAMRTASQQLST